MVNNMDNYELLRNIEQFMIKNNQTFFSYSWREKINEFMSSESKYSRLIDWINDQIEYYRNNLNVFNPADKTDDYNNSYFKTYEDACKNVAMLLNFKWILLDNHCTTEMRNNIEYSICKLYKIHYSKELDCYV